MKEGTKSGYSISRIPSFDRFLAAQTEDPVGPWKTQLAHLPVYLFIIRRNDIHGSICVVASISG